MRHFTLALLLLPFLAAAQHAPAPPYKLAVLPGWTTEQFTFPIEFAPQIAYKGWEDLRFTPGWSDPASEEHWSYSFLWWLSGSPLIDADNLEKNLTAYYDGLVGRNITQRKIPKNKVVSTRASIKKAKTAADDIATFSGTIRMLNYMTQRPVTLNCMVHVKKCKEERRTAVYFEISPQPATHAVWQQFDKIWNDFSCGK